MKRIAAPIILYVLLLPALTLADSLPWGDGCETNTSTTRDENCDVLMSSISAAKGTAISLPVWMLVTTAKDGGFDVAWNNAYVRFLSWSSTKCTATPATTTVPANKYRIVCKDLDAKEKTMLLGTLKLRTQQLVGTSSITLSAPQGGFSRCVLQHGKVTVK